MSTQQLIGALVSAGYSLRFIASQAGVSYMKVWRYHNSGGALSDTDEAAIRRFALVQPAVAEARQ